MPTARGYIPLTKPTVEPASLSVSAEPSSNTYGPKVMTSGVISQVQRISALSSSMQDRMAPAFRQIQEASSHVSDVGAAFDISPDWESVQIFATATQESTVKGQRAKPKMRPLPEIEYVDVDEGDLSASDSNRPVPVGRVEDGVEGNGKGRGRGKAKQTSVSKSLCKQ
jgi:hypothetical protein